MLGEMSVGLAQGGEEMTAGKNKLGVQTSEEKSILRGFAPRVIYTEKKLARG